MNLEQARQNMVEQQIRTWEVLDQEVLDLLLTIRREDFVPPASVKLAFAETSIPLGNGAAMLTPALEAKFVQALQSRKSDKVLEVGTGSGVQSAYIANLTENAYTIEIIAPLAQRTRSVTTSTPDFSKSARSRTESTVSVIAGACWPMRSDT